MKNVNKHAHFLWSGYYKGEWGEESAKIKKRTIKALKDCDSIIITVFSNYLNFSQGEEGRATGLEALPYVTENRDTLSGAGHARAKRGGLWGKRA